MPSSGKLWKTKSQLFAESRPTIGQRLAAAVIELRSLIDAVEGHCGHAPQTKSLAVLRQRAASARAMLEALERRTIRQISN